jgi:hypothetical protein
MVKIGDPTYESILGSIFRDRKLRVKSEDNERNLAVAISHPPDFSLGQIYLDSLNVKGRPHLPTSNIFYRDTHGT